MAAVTLVTLARHYRRRWGIFIAALGAVLGVILLGAGTALIVRPGLWGLTPSWPYGLLGLGLGGAGSSLSVSIYAIALNLRFVPKVLPGSG